MAPRRAQPEPSAPAQEDPFTGWTDAERAALRAWLGDLKWVSPKKALRSIPLLRRQYEVYATWSASVCQPPNT